MSSARKRKAPQLRRNLSVSGDQGDSKVRAKNDRSGDQWCEPSTYSDWLGDVSVATEVCGSSD